MDQLQIKDLEIFAYHGLFPSEKELGQKFVVSDIEKPSYNHLKDNDLQRH